MNYSSVTHPTPPDPPPLPPGSGERPQRPDHYPATYRQQLRQWRDVPLVLHDLAADAGDHCTRRLALRLWDRLITVTEEEG